MTTAVYEPMADDAKNAGQREANAIKRRQRRKNIALAVLLAGFAILVYFVAIVRMGGGG